MQGSSIQVRPRTISKPGIHRPKVLSPGPDQDGKILRNPETTRTKLGPKMRFSIGLGHNGPWIPAQYNNSKYFHKPNSHCLAYFSNMVHMVIIMDRFLLLVIYHFVLRFQQGPSQQVNSQNGLVLITCYKLSESWYVFLGQLQLLWSMTVKIPRDNQFVWKLF